MTPQTEDKVAEPTRLARKLNTFDAIVIGLGSMIGAGVFAVVGPAAQAAGTGLLAALVIAALVAYCNALSSAQLAALYPESGGTYVYGRKRLGAFWGFLAGWGFVVGKLASCAAMALTFASYAAPQWVRPLAVTAVLVMTTVNYFGIETTAMLTRAIVIVVLVSLGIVVATTLYGREIETERLMPLTGTGPHGVLQAAGLWFFAFAGYARLATLGEEVVDPARTIPRAIPLALGITLLVYAAVAITALLAVDCRHACSSGGATCNCGRSRRLAGLVSGRPSRRHSGVARRAAVAACRCQPDRVLDGRKPRSTAVLRRRSSALSRSSPRRTRCRNTGRLDRCIRRSAFGDRLQRVYRAHVLRSDKRVGL